MATEYYKAVTAPSHLVVAATKSTFGRAPDRMTLFSLMPERRGNDGSQSPDGDIKIKKTRASRPKVKTGCQTCKFVQGFICVQISASS